MQNRLRFLRGAAALLYFGPLLAGLGGFGWSVVPIFVMLFLLWLFILRPHQWPRTLEAVRRPGALVSVLTQIVVQVLLVAVCFGIGRGVGGVLGALPPFPLMLPVAISFLSIPLGRMMWDPWKEAEVNTLLDDALAGSHEQHGDPRGRTEDQQANIRMVGRMVEELAKLQIDVTEATLTSHLFAIASEAGHERLRVALMDPVYDGTASPLLRRAVIVHATDGRVVDYLSGTNYPLAVFNALTHAEDLQLFARRCEDMLRTDPDTAAECPEPSQVLSKAENMPLASAELTHLADILSKAQAVR